MIKGKRSPRFLRKGESETNSTAITRRCLSFCRKTPTRARCIAAVCRLLPWLCVALYGALLLYNVICFDWPRMLRVTLIPLSALVVGSVFRAVLNCPRPYDVDREITPLLSHHSGRSFPSRHCVSACVIATAFWYTNLWLGVVTACMALCVAVSRVLCGVHFVKDVLAGLLFGFGWGALLFSIF